ncbi:MAG: Rdx family protein [Pseudomonadales bacterium]
MPAAASLAARLKSAFAVDATLVRGAGGVFDVVVDGTLRYSKAETHTFPDEEALIAQLRDLS